MSIETDVTRLAMLRACGAVPVSYTGGSFWAIYDAAFLLVDTGTGVETKSPVLTARTSDVAELQKDSLLTVEGETYQVKRHEPDGTGITVLVLRR